MVDLALHDKVELDFPSSPKNDCLVSKFFVKYMYIYIRGDFKMGKILNKRQGVVFPFSALTACVIRAHEV